MSYKVIKSRGKPSKLFNQSHTAYITPYHATGYYSLGGRHVDTHAYRHADQSNFKKPGACSRTTPQVRTKTKSNRKSKDRANDTKHTPEECHNPNCYKSALDNIVNLFDIQLTQAQVLLLNRGLSFVPQQVMPNPWKSSRTLASSQKRQKTNSGDWLTYQDHRDQMMNRYSSRDQTKWKTQIPKH